MPVPLTWGERSGYLRAVPQVRRARAHELRQDPAGSSGKCGDCRYGLPGVHLPLFGHRFQPPPRSRGSRFRSPHANLLDPELSRFTAWLIRPLPDSIDPAPLRRYQGRAMCPRLSDEPSRPIVLATRTFSVVHAGWGRPHSPEFWRWRSIALIAHPRVSPADSAIAVSGFGMDAQFSMWSRSTRRLIAVWTMLETFARERCTRRQKMDATRCTSWTKRICSPARRGTRS